MEGPNLVQVFNGKKLAGGSSPQELERLLRKGKEQIVPHIPWSKDKVMGKQQAGCWEIVEPHAGRYLYMPLCGLFSAKLGNWTHSTFF